MPRPPFSRLLVAVLLGLPLGLGAAAAGEGPAAPWWRLSDGRLTLESNGSADQARQLSVLLASLRETVSGLAFGEPRDLEVPTTVVVFADAVGYEPFRIHQRDGQFYTTPFESLVVVNAAASRRPIERIVAHEYLHALLRSSGLALPLWLDEGLAEYYSTARIEAGRLVLGAAAGEHRRRLGELPLLGFDELARMSPGSPDYLDEAHAERFYAESWLLVHYLISQPGGSERLSELVRRLDRGATPEAALQSSLGYDGVELDRRLRRHLEQDATHEVAMPLSGRSPRWAGRALTPGEVAMRMAIVATEQLRWHESPERTELARSRVAQMLAVRPLDGDRLAVAARLEETLDQRSEAADLYARSLELGAREGRSFAYYARFLLDESRRSGDAEETLGEARRVLARALAAAPEHPWLLALERELVPARPAGREAGRGGAPR